MLVAQENQAEGPVFQVKSSLEILQSNLKETKLMIDSETLFKNSYLHMLDRMKKDLIATKISSGEMEGSLKNKSQILDLENQKHRKTKEERLQAKSIFDNLMKNIEKE